MKHKLLGVLALSILAISLAACGSSDLPTPAQPLEPQATPADRATSAPPEVTVLSTATSTTDTPTSTSEPATATTLPTETPAPTATVQPVELSAVSLELEQIAGGLNSPVFATHAGDGSGRLFVVEKPGTIVVLGPDSQQQGAFLDIRNRVGSGGFEQGLLGLAFHPQFVDNGRLFVYYTDKNGNTVISRFQANDARSAADPDGEVVLLTQDQPAANHNGGMLAFGPDGRLYAGLGDGGRAGDPWGNAQNLDTLLGKLLRIDVDAAEPYAIPADNPFANQEGARPEIWAYGLRNPWRFSFDRATGDLWIGDVGQNQWEEINWQPSFSAGGENYGWKIMEGTHCYEARTCDQNGLVLPVAEYEHGDDGCSVTGGYVYRGAALPALSGAYLYGDYCSGRIWGLVSDAPDQRQASQLLDTNLQISSFGEAENGEMLVVDLNGTLYRLVQK